MHAEIAEICRRYRVTRLEVFGSVARGTDFDTETSDVDFLVEYHPESDISFFGHTRLLLADIEQAAEEIAGFIKGVECEAFVLNVEKQRAVERNFGIIGEAMNQLHHVIHGGITVDPHRVWLAAVNDLPNLLDTVREMLAELNPAPLRKPEPDSSPSPS